ncbi:MAG TPA: TatD family hydrolase [Vicinamibacterales bacterium]
MIDSHCHLADEAFAGDLEAVVGRAREAGVSDGVCILSLGDEAEASRLPRVLQAWPDLRVAIGAHPHQAHDFSSCLDEVAERVRAAHARTPGACAIGEIGLDYHYDFSPREVQRDVFRVQVRLARELRRPVIIHTREADEDTVSILEEEGRGDVRGVFHCFSGTDALADRALALGLMLSFSGIVTFPRAGNLRTIAARTPADRLLVETDCPYLAPVPLRGKRNEPAWVVRTAAVIAEHRGMALAELDAAVGRNFKQVFAQ